MKQYIVFSANTSGLSSESCKSNIGPIIIPHLTIWKKRSWKSNLIFVKVKHKFSESFESMISTVIIIMEKRKY